jgi:excisionase family DNA binding protein
MKDHETTATTATSKTVTPEIKKLAYKPREAAAAIGLGVTRTRELIADGTIKSLREGSRIIVPAWALEEYLSRGRVAGTGGEQGGGGDGAGVGEAGSGGRGTGANKPSKSKKRA